MDLKQFPRLEKTKIVLYSVTSKLNSNFGTTANTMAGKMTAIVGEKYSSFRISVKN